MQPLFRFVSVGSAAAALAVLAACGSAPTTQPVVVSSPTPVYSTPARAEFGRVSNIEVVRTEERGRTSGAGAVVGGVVGGVLGSQIGGGRGQDLATVAGVVGGAVVGNSVERNRRADSRESYRVSIQLDGGGYRAYDVGQSAGDLRVGDRVRIDNGQISRV